MTPIAPTFTVTTEVSAPQTDTHFTHCALRYDTNPPNPEVIFNLIFLREELLPDAPLPRVVFDLGRIIVINRDTLEIIARSHRNGTSHHHPDGADFTEIACDTRALQRALLKLLDLPLPTVDPQGWGFPQRQHTLKWASFTRYAPLQTSAPVNLNLVQVVRSSLEHSRANVLRALLYYRRNLEPAGRGLRPLPLDGVTMETLADPPRWQRCLESVRLYARQQLHALRWGKEENYELGFNGRFAGGCGYNGGIILHGAGTASASVGVHT